MHKIPPARLEKALIDLDTGALLSLIRGYIDDPGRTGQDKAMILDVIEVLQMRLPKYQQVLDLMIGGLQCDLVESLGLLLKPLEADEEIQE